MNTRKCYYRFLVPFYTAQAYQVKINYSKKDSPCRQTLAVHKKGGQYLLMSTKDFLYWKVCPYEPERQAKNASIVISSNKSNIFHNKWIFCSKLWTFYCIRIEKMALRLTKQSDEWSIEPFHRRQNECKKIVTIIDQMNECFRGNQFQFLFTNDYVFLF